VLDLTTGVLNPHGVCGDIHRNVTADFQRWYVVLAYTVAVVALGLHLRHGVWSALRSLGFGSAARARAVRVVAFGYAAVITVGFLSVPLAVLFGLGG
jgi:succinate dehydrogenase / fumarate reductase, cytochrome b subunit